MVEIAYEQYSKDPSSFEKLLNDAEKSSYEGCKKFTKLSTLVKLYNLKVRHEKNTKSVKRHLTFY